MGQKKPNAPDYYWYQKLRVLLEETSPLHPTFLFWSGIIGGADSQELINVGDFCALGQTEIIPWTQANLLLYTSAEILDAYARNTLYSRFCKDA